jgi:CDP-paratose 2-epimerase
MKTLLVTGSSGLIGSEVVDYCCRIGWKVHGIDNNMRANFFGPPGDTRWNQRRLQSIHTDFRHHELDIRDRKEVEILRTVLDRRANVPYCRLWSSWVDLRLRR